MCKLVCFSEHPNIATTLQEIWPHTALRQLSEMAFIFLAVTIRPLHGSPIRNTHVCFYNCIVFKLILLCTTQQSNNMAQDGRRFKQLAEEHWIPVVRFGVNNIDADPPKTEQGRMKLDLITGVCGREIQSPNRKGIVMHWVELGSTVVFRGNDDDEDGGDMPLVNISTQSRTLHPGNRFKHLLAEHFNVAAIPWTYIHILVPARMVLVRL